MSYFISQEQDGGWRVDADDLVARLRERWPDARLRTIEDPGRKYSHEFSITTRTGTVDGMIHRNRTSLVFDASPEAAAEFVTWYQNEVIGTDHNLLLYDEQFVRVAPLKPGIGAQEIEAVLR